MTAGLPEWVAPGSEVVALTGRYNTPSDVLTIERVMKRDVVLSDGSRWSRARIAPNGTHITKLGGGVWDPYDALFPADAERVAVARQDAERRSIVHRCRVDADKIADSIRVADWDEARRIHARLGRWLANAPNPPEQEGDPT